jgi:hypothetical protein
MPFALSPGVTVIEKDFSSIIPAVSTSAGATAGVFSWGPVSEPTTVTSEDVLVERFGKPNDSNYKSFFTAANFLSYTNNLIVNRVDTTGLRNAVSSSGGEVLDVTFTIAGSGFKPGHNTIVTFSAPQTSGGVTATGLVILTGGAVTGFTVGTGGSGYVTAPAVTLSAPDIEGGQQALATATISNGVVTAITLVSGSEGTGYTVAPTVTIATAPQGGTNAVASATIATSSVSKIRITNGGSGYTAAPTVTITASNQGSVGAVVLPTNLTAVLSSSSGVKIRNSQHYLGSFRDYQQSVYGMFAAKYPGTMGNGIQIILIDNAVYTWAAANTSNPTAKLILGSFPGAPGTSTQASLKGITNDELHVLVLDSNTGTWTGTPNSVLEKYTYLSKLKSVTRNDGTNLYFRDAINSGSKYLWVLNTPSSVQISDPQNLDWTRDVNTITAGSNLRDLNAAAVIISLSGGQDDFAATAGNVEAAFMQFLNADLYDISLVAAGDVSVATANKLIGDLGEVRRDCVVFVSPRNTDGTPIIASGDEGVQAIKTFKTTMTNSTYAVLDSGAKYQYDRYNDVYRWIPLNGDMAGLCARTDYTADPWFSPGGFTRGQVKNVVKLGFNPGQVERDNLYKESVNPVVTFPGQGTVLFGDKTFTSKPSAFDRINVRRLFIVLEKAIATAAKYQLFEYNDDFTRAQFRNLVEPFLRNVQGRRGIIDFRVKCDATNNTGEVIDRNEFVASLFIKPNRSINFITLNFVAARSSVSFDEIGG